MTPALLPTSAAPGFHFGDLYAVALLAAGLALLLAVVALSRGLSGTPASRGLGLEETVDQWSVAILAALKEGCGEIGDPPC